MKKKITETILKGWITSLIGLIIMGFTTLKAYESFDSLTITHFFVIVLMMTLGAILFKSKDKILLDIFKFKMSK